MHAQNTVVASQVEESQLQLGYGSEVAHEQLVAAPYTGQALPNPAPLPTTTLEGNVGCAGALLNSACCLFVALRGVL
jgi:hypothetical protein